jgi:ABC-type transport system involved in cytochrome c biogenesis permease subunit
MVKMTQARKRAIFTFFIWGSVMAAFAVIFFAGQGPERYALEKWRRIAGAVIIAFGFAAYYTMLFLTRNRRGTRGVVTDERDEDIRRRANGASFIVVLLYVFLLAIYLWERYQGSGFVPVGWMWFLAYSTSFAAYITSSIAALILESKASGRGQS